MRMQNVHRELRGSRPASSGGPAVRRWFPVGHAGPAGSCVKRGACLGLAAVALLGSPVFGRSPFQDQGSGQGTANQGAPNGDDGAPDGIQVPSEAQRPLGGIEILGGIRFSEEDILGLLGQEIGQPLDAERLSRGVRTLWEIERIRPRVDFRVVGGEVFLRLQALEMPRDPAPRFIGNEREDLDQILEWAGLEQASELYLFESSRVARAIEEGYRKKGYFFAEVEAVTREVDRDSELAAALPADVIFEIHEGPRVRVRKLEIVGNESLPDRGWWIWRTGLRAEARPELGAPWLFGWFPDYLTSEAVQGDVIGIRQAYRDRGYLDAVVELEELDFSEDRRWVTVRVLVDEGPLYSVRSVRIEGAESEALVLPESELLELCELAPGEPFSQYVIRRDEFGIQRRYAELGYTSHSSIPPEQRFQFLDPEIVLDPTRPVVDVVYRINQGLPQRIRELAINGASRTQDRVVRREIRLQPGDLVNLGEVERSLARLRGLGFFSSAGLAANHVEPFFRFVETDDPGEKILEFVLEEGSSIRLDAGVQIGTDNGLAGQFGITIGNFDVRRWPSWGRPVGDIVEGRAFRGAGQSLRLFAAPGTDVNRFQARFDEPDLFGRHYDRIGGSVDWSRFVRFYQTHDETRDSLRLSLYKQLGPDTRLGLNWSATEIEVEDLVPGLTSLSNSLGVPQALVDQLGESSLRSIGASLSHNQLDDPRFPREGFQASGSVDVHTDLLGSDYDFVSALFNYTQYGDLGEERRSPVYNLRLRAGVQVPFGDTEDVPFTERYFLGGSRWLRGFRFRGVGPNENGFAQGGATMIAGSFEVLWPILIQDRPDLRRPMDVFRGGFFVDAGVLDPDPFELDLDELRLSVGVTLGMVQPIPIRLNFGFPVLEEDGDSKRTFTFTFSL
jgi:outer membrane protein insertion porin family